jgi:hypothetical protein
MLLLISIYYKLLFSKFMISYKYGINHDRGIIVRIWWIIM